MKREAVLISGPTPKERETEIRDYGGERRVKTDEAAPHPDMDAVAAALKKLEAKEPKP